MTYGTPADPLRARWRRRHQPRIVDSVWLIAWALLFGVAAAALGVALVLAGAVAGYALVGWLP